MYYWLHPSVPSVTILCSEASPPVFRGWSLRPGLITKEAEKRVNSGINTWMRTPFGVVGAYILFQVALYKSLDFGEIVSVLTVAGLVLWNSIYYGRRVVENYGGETRLVLLG